MFRKTTGPISVTIMLVVAAIGNVSCFAQAFRSSVVGTDIDFITEADPSCFLCIEFKGAGYREMPDKSQDSPLIQKAFIFLAFYADGSRIDIAIDSDFLNQQAAQKEAQKYVGRIGKLPTSLRRGIERLVVHQGNPDTTAFSDRGLIIMYSDNANKRISTHDLEETLFHESVHASWDPVHATSEPWQRAQAADGAFVTDYAKKKPGREDLAETALFAFTMIHHPDRIPKKVSSKIAKSIPARLRFIETLLPHNKPLVYPIGPKYRCDGSATTFELTQADYLLSQQQFKTKMNQQNTSPSQVQSKCTIDLRKPGHMKDILSNALMAGLAKDEPAVQSFLKDSEKKFQSGDELLTATAKHFRVDIEVLRKQVESFRHVNCQHGDIQTNK